MVADILNRQGIEFPLFVNFNFSSSIKRKGGKCLVSLTTSHLIIAGEAKGNQLLTLTGKGFSSDASVTVCGKVCEVLQEESSSNTLVCLTPPGTGMCIQRTLLITTAFVTKDFAVKSILRL